MSTFGGKIQEIPNISIDRFDANNLQSEVYFLSHCHTDHMVGLNTWFVQNILLKSNKFLYASEISCAILKKCFPDLESNVKVLDMYSPTIIVLKEGNISVLPIPAGHCPGSVMFLFESNSRILYTGDYRINKNDICKFTTHFCDIFKQVKAIDTIYLDTTFFLKNYLKFPKREESLEELCKIIGEWVEKGKNYAIKLATCARYGYEYMFKEIYDKTGMPVHVNNDAFEFYSKIPEMDNSITLDGAATQIHCSCGSSYKHVCDKAATGELRTIKISAFRWTQNNLEDGFSSTDSNIYYVCYSTHASYEEGVELIRFLKPKSVEICVKHDNPHTNVEIRKLLDEALEECRPEKETIFRHKLFETEVAECPLAVLEEETNERSFDFGILDSPPRNRTHRKLPRKRNVQNVSCTVDERLVSLNDSFTVRSGQMQSSEEGEDGSIVRRSLNVVEIDGVLNESPPRKKFN